VAFVEGAQRHERDGPDNDAGRIDAPRALEELECAAEVMRAMQADVGVETIAPTSQRAPLHP
jgi:hypothetical protein